MIGRIMVIGKIIIGILIMIGKIIIMIGKRIIMIMIDMMIDNCNDRR